MTGRPTFSEVGQAFSLTLRLRFLTFDGGDFDSSTSTKRLPSLAAAPPLVRGHGSAGMPRRLGA